jgi:nucleotidyltransferase substrate binding protein (TIGR01987 family)
MIDYSKFHKALVHLNSQNQHYQSSDESLPQYLQDALKESVVQRFETCWDCLWKVLKRHLEEAVGLAELPNGPKPVLRLANENHLLPSGIEKWIEYNEARIDTSHDYSGVKADDALKQMNNFISDAIALYEILSGNAFDA